MAVVSSGSAAGVWPAFVLVAFLSNTGDVATVAQTDNVAAVAQAGEVTAAFAADAVNVAKPVKAALTVVEAVEVTVS